MQVGQLSIRALPVALHVAVNGILLTENSSLCYCCSACVRKLLGEGPRSLFLCMVCQMQALIQTLRLFAVAGLFCYPENNRSLAEKDSRAIMTVFVLSQTAKQPLILNKVCAHVQE